MRAAVFDPSSAKPGAWLTLEERPTPEVRPGEMLLKVIACGVCRTDLHIVEGDLRPIHRRIVPGHQIVGEVTEGVTTELPLGARAGVSWLGGVDGDCWFCSHGMENLCDHPVFTGYSVDGGYADYALVRGEFAFPLPKELEPQQLAPLLCAGIIGYRSLRIAGVERGDRVGLYGFGSSAALAIRILQSWECEVYVATRGEGHRKAAESAGAAWVGTEDAMPPTALDRAITFAPSGKVVVAALSALRKGGIVAINAIHLDGMPAFDYDTLLWGERQIRSVANVTRQDARDFLDLVKTLKIQPRVVEFPLEGANEALRAMKDENLSGAAVIVIQDAPSSQRL
jgi:alcohol dehydrogenase, propanol-preferring